MSSVPPQHRHICPSCGATWVAGMSRCYLCGHNDTPQIQPIARAEAVPDPPQRSFSLATLMVAVTLLSVCLAIGHYSPGLGILAALVVLPTWYEYKRRIRRRQLLDLPITGLNRAQVLIVAMGWVVLVVVVLSVFLLPLFFA